ncbi:hypothetical protein N799_02240 [Lysobacter arseniciresistens ZS79]|uniref:Uncharacterized protein n=1 Tax=Lysobacter arseniciresistens ZS79 TaxID=913325 RepID=A0A0A0F2G0_9GAMM|nr:hypothetical protein [Lysobacter arseniciresistens]KGM56730.1 hypothetical protein N799_02240 [Lysobacter arseniciresistens ZS79]
MRLVVEVFALVLLALATPAAAADWPDVPMPGGAEGIDVAADMLFNGLPMSTRKFRTSDRPDDVKRFYRDEWAGAVVENDLGAGTVLGHLEGRYYITVQIEGVGGGTEATVGIMDTRVGKPEQPPGAWLARPANTEVLSDVQYLDLDGRPRTLALRNTLGPSQNYLFYRSRLAADGWKPEGPGCSVMASRCLVEFSRGDEHLSLAIQREGDSTTVLANRTGG